MTYEEAGTNVRNAVYTGVISTTITLLVTVLSLLGTTIGGINAWNFLDVGVSAGLTYGVYKCSRFCAISLFAYYVFSKGVTLHNIGLKPTFVVALIIAYFYFQGIRGVIAIQQYKKQ
ncbi:MAG: hypothetical protein HY043_07830 [Verrucomicrobia bacterium]|nr:hypothetical protein [Verrucomicrobiota bacterium]